MAEVLGLAASVFAVFQLTGKLISLSYDYIGSAIRAPKSLAELADELGSLGRVLTALKGYADAQAHSNSATCVLQLLNEPGGPLQRCRLDLENLESQLMQRGMVDLLRWPLKEKGTAEALVRIERHKAIFLVALTVDQISLSREIEKYVQGINITVEDTRMDVRNTKSTVEKIETYVKSTSLVVQDLQAEFEAQKVWRKSNEHLKQRQESLDKKQQIICNAERRHDVLRWIYKQDFDTKHLEISGRRQKNTGKWILKTPEFQNWEAKKIASQVLCAYGIPGAGKTFLSSVVIDHFQDQAPVTKHGFAYLYFDYKEQDRQTPICVISSLIKQLASQIPSLVLEIGNLYDRASKKPTLDELSDALVATSVFFDRVFLILDALDESDQQKQRNHLLPLFHRLLVTNNDISLFITSRHYPEDIQYSFCYAAKIEISARAEDIAIYIQEKIQADPRARRLIQQSGCHDRIISELTECAQGMFLLVHFHIQHLCQQTTGRQVLKALEKLKDSTTEDKPLDPTYDKAIESLHRRPKSSTELALKILSWLVKAQRKLTVEEIQVAVSVEPSRYELDELDLPNRATILDVCAGLVTIDDTNDGSTISLAHYTVQEYLLRNSVILEDADFQLAMACATFLSFDIFTEGACTSADSMNHRLISHPFLRYAAPHLLFHIKACDEILATDMVLRFLRKRNTLSSYLQAIEVTKYGCQLFDRYPRRWLSLHMVSSLDHTATRILLASAADPETLDNEMSTALHLATLHGNDTLVRLLLDHGASPSTPDLYGAEPLWHAVSQGHENMVKLLLNSGANIANPGLNGTTPLWQAASRGHEIIVRLLIDSGADVLTPDCHGTGPLYVAALNGYETTVKLLLDNGADVSSSGNGRTPLQQAVYAGNDTIVKLLLDSGANTSNPDVNGTTPLWQAVSQGHENIVQLLLNNGVDVSTPCHGKIPLLEAASRGNKIIFQLLLDYGANISAPDAYGTTPLLEAVSRGHQSIVRLLINNGADVSTPDVYGMTPLSVAVSGGHESIAQLLIGNGASILNPS